MPTGRGTLGGAGMTLARGKVFVVTSDLVEASRDRNGDPGWPALVHDEEKQTAFWGRRMLAPADDVTEDLSIPERGSAAWEEAREAARVAAWRIEDPRERALARAAVERRYGPAPLTSSTTWSDPAERERLDASARAADARAQGGALR
ncbi:hypothetical protein IFU08_09775 [Microbacterium sp. CFBP 8790]|uniref:hypothetical protein n=1 Tax=unclassified Microbacterium TaxID=2609290 RepID=UPI00177EB988|nr:MULTISPECIES: hypothetical protein [unclassified Microbacterium]MBD8205092.1 hypothetical protein [Microbacterium sp. CFBP 8801]MBD8509853.1 hypothetical protein [Microbacterium sp. CFBP 8790]